MNAVLTNVVGDEVVVGVRQVDAVIAVHADIIIYGVVGRVGSEVDSALGVVLTGVVGDRVVR